MNTTISEAPLERSFRAGNGVILHLPSDIALPPAPMPLIHRGRMLKRWRYFAVWSPQLSLSACRIRVGPIFQEFWAIWDGQTLHQRTRLWPGPVDLGDSRIVIHERDVSAELTLREVDAFQVLTKDTRAYTWTRKQLVQVSGSVRPRGTLHQLHAQGLVDDSAGYHPRHTRYKWSAGAGVDTRDRQVVWNLVTGINDGPTHSERTIWVEGVPQETEPVRIDGTLTGVIFADGGRLDFQARAMRETRDNLFVIRSHYRHPFGTYSGTLPGNIHLREGHGVMEDHDVYW